MRAYSYLFLRLAPNRPNVIRPKQFLRKRQSYNLSNISWQKPQIYVFILLSKLQHPIKVRQYLLLADGHSVWQACSYLFPRRSVDQSRADFQVNYRYCMYSGRYKIDLDSLSFGKTRSYVIKRPHLSISVNEICSSNFPIILEYPKNCVHLCVESMFFIFRICINIRTTIPQGSVKAKLDTFKEQMFTY